MLVEAVSTEDDVVVVEDVDWASELVDGSGDSVLKIEDGPTGILPVLPASGPFGPPPPPCWPGSVELENVEAILTAVYYY